jgi:hypothetical protein
MGETSEMRQRERDRGGEIEGSDRGETEERKQQIS